MYKNSRARQPRDAAGRKPTMGLIENALAELVWSRYLDLVCLLPVTALLGGLTWAVFMDLYIQKRRKQTTLILCALVFSLIAQNYADNLLSLGKTRIMLRKIICAYGYAVRPTILLLFLKILDPGKKHIPGWILVGVNAALHAVSVFVPLCFRIDEHNAFGGSVFPFGYTCTAVSLILLGMLLVQSLRLFRRFGRKESSLPVIVFLLILLSLILDSCVGSQPQPVSFLTIFILIGCIMYYSWLHMVFVREHEEAIAVGQRAQLMLSQIKPHFLYNVLNMTEEPCDTDPEKARNAIGTFSRYLRENMDSIGQTGVIPFQKELDHTKLYVEIEQMRFEDALTVRYDVACTDFSIPALTLEPLVENAIRHGVRKNPGGRGTVVISTSETPARFAVSVTDDGPGFDPAALPADGKSHVGLPNVRERLEQVCGGSLDIQSAPGRGTVATIILPKRQEAGSC